VAYEVTKLIAGREYRYHVEGARDPKTKRVKQTWTYLGRVDGNTTVDVRRRSQEDVRDRVLRAALHLLDRRDVSHLTIDVLVRAARVSRATFYRHFPGRTAALNAAIGSVYDQLLEVPLRVDEPLISIDAERLRLRSWAETLLRAAVQRPGIHRALLSSEKLRKERAKQVRINREVVLQSLVSYLNRLHAAGLIGNVVPDVLANGIICATAGVVKQLVYDRVDMAPEVLIAGTSEMICRSVFPHDG
jgi:AcrR family transcriptional regulator